jgi:hypothetical protein
LDWTTAVVSAASAVLGGAVGSWLSSFYQRRLAQQDHRTRRAVDYLDQLGQVLHDASFALTGLGKATSGGRPDEVRSTVETVVGLVSASQLAKVVVQEWHPEAARVITDWENRMLRYVFEVQKALDSGDSANEMRLAREAFQKRADDDDLGLEAAMQGIARAIRIEIKDAHH